MRMKMIITFLGLMTAAAIVFIAPPRHAERKNPAVAEILSPRYKWKQLAPPGSGTHQYEWKKGTYPSAVVPVKAWNNELWMVGRNKTWSSKDGVQWKDHDKRDWGERISTTTVFFNNALWTSGGMEYATTKFLNEIWSSKDGENWTRVVEHAEWSPRKNHTLVVFKGKLWLFGGETSVDEHKAPNEFINDVWTSDDGLKWRKILNSAPWEVRGSPRILVFRDRLWLVGGQGRSDVWNSEDGKHWKKVTDSTPWNGRYDYGATAFDSLLWVYGGRDSNPRNAHNDVWFSPNGVNWIQQTSEAPWTRRSGGFSIALHDRLLLYGGKHTGHEDGFSGDIWALERDR